MTAPGPRPGRRDLLVAGAAGLTAAWSAAPALPAGASPPGSGGTPSTSLHDATSGSGPMLADEPLDLLAAVTRGCHAMSNVLNPDDAGRPWFGQQVVPHDPGQTRFYYSGNHDESHVPGRHLLALLEARALGVTVDPAVIAAHRAAAEYSLSREVPLPQNRGALDDPRPYRFLPHNVREGLHAMVALYAHEPGYAATAHRRIEAMLGAIERFWTPDGGWDRDALVAAQRDLVLGEWSSPFVTGLGRAIGPLARYWRLSRDRGEESAAARRLLDVLVPLALDHFSPTGTAARDLGTHVHSITCTMSGLAWLGHLADRPDLLDRVHRFFRVGLTRYRDALGWSVENASDLSDRGEANNTGDIVETALLLGMAGHRECYADAARILAGHLVPAQLIDTGFVWSPENPRTDAYRDVGTRLAGAFGFPAPYGHLPVGWPSASFNLDIVGGATASLCVAHRWAVGEDDGVLTVRLPVDHRGDDLTVEVEGRGHTGLLVLRPTRRRRIRVVLPPWLAAEDVRVRGGRLVADTSPEVVEIDPDAAGEPVRLSCPRPLREIHLAHPRRPIRTWLRGDRVVAMDSYGQGLAFFPAVPAAPLERPARGLVGHWRTPASDTDRIPGLVPRAEHDLLLLGGARVGDHGGRRALVLGGGPAFAAAGAPAELAFGAHGFTLASWVSTRTTGRGRLLSNGSFGWSYGYFLGVGLGGPGLLCFGIGAGADSGPLGSVEVHAVDGRVDDGAWHHVAVTVDRPHGEEGVVTLFVDGRPRPLRQTGATIGVVDGTLLHLPPTTPALASSPAALTVGAHLGTDEFLSGAVDDVRCYDRPLRRDEVAELARPD